RAADAGAIPPFVSAASARPACLTRSRSVALCAPVTQWTSIAEPLYEGLGVSGNEVHPRPMEWPQRSLQGAAHAFVVAGFRVEVVGQPLEVPAMRVACGTGPVRDGAHRIGVLAISLPRSIDDEDALGEHQLGVERLILEHSSELLLEPADTTKHGGTHQQTVRTRHERLSREQPLEQSRWVE